MKRHNPASFIPFFAFLAFAAAPARAALVPVSPVNGETIALVPDAQKKVMDLPTLAERIALFRDDRERGGKVIRHDPLWRKAKPFTLAWRATEGETGPWKVEIGKGPDFDGADIRYLTANSESVKVTDGEVFIYTMPRSNLEIARTWYWRVTGLGKPDEGKKNGAPVRSATASFATEDRAPRWIELEGKIWNIRDLGGWRTADGRRVRQGMAFRGQGLNYNSVTGERQGRNRLTVEDVKYLTGTLGIRTDLDLRSKSETDWESTFYPNIPDDIHETEPDFWCRESRFTDGIGAYGEPGDTWQRRCELYLLDCGITEEEIASLREILLEPEASRSTP